LAVH
ncbi:valine--tRNA ligase, partial [Vibrio parahaemolyticus VPTS-2010]|jgi:hypothetical protein